MTHDMNDVTMCIADYHQPRASKTRQSGRNLAKEPNP